MKFTFEDNVLDCDRRELRRRGERIALGPQVLDLLMHLLRNRERVVSKSDLVEVVWSGRAISDSTLTSHINAARKAVADSGEEQRLIRTLPRKGYRFVGEVMEVRPRESKAVSAVEEQLRMLHPTLRIAQIKDWILLRRPEDTITFTEGLRQAGLPA